jgi:short-subunit dehydrogenase
MPETGDRWQNIWITGASSGIGLELAKLLGGKAGQVAISARSAEKLVEIESLFDAIKAYPLDVTDALAVEKCVDDVVAGGGSIDLAVLGAGTWTILEPAVFDVKAIRKGIEVNYMGVVHAVAALLPGMIARGHGHIAIIASTAGYRGLPRSAAYGPSKAALINLAETLKIELAPLGIHVSLVCPGFVDTPMTQENRFPMPDIITASQAAKALLKGLEGGKFEIIFPLRFVLAMKLLQLLPNSIFFWVIRKFVFRQSS